MNNTLNNLALFSFKRKARKLGKNIEVSNLTDQGFFEDHLIRMGETLLIWSEENGFHSISTEVDIELAYLVKFPAKYEHDEVYHFGILNKEKTRLYVYRCHEQYKTAVLGLRSHVEEYLYNEAFQETEMDDVY